MEEKRRKSRLPLIIFAIVVLFLGVSLFVPILPCVKCKGDGKVEQTHDLKGTRYTTPQLEPCLDCGGRGKAPLRSLVF